MLVTKDMKVICFSLSQILKSENHSILDNESSSNSQGEKDKEASPSSSNSKVVTDTNNSAMESSNSAGISSNSKVDSGSGKNSENGKQSMKNGETGAATSLDAGSSQGRIILGFTGFQLTKLFYRVYD